MEIVDLVAEDDVVVARFTYAITLPSGEDIKARGMTFYRLYAGRIVEDDAITSPDLMQAFGVDVCAELFSRRRAAATNAEPSTRDVVGKAWIVSASVSIGTFVFTASTASWIASGAPGPAMNVPRTRCDFLSTTTVAWPNDSVTLPLALDSRSTVSSNASCPARWPHRAGGRRRQSRDRCRSRGGSRRNRA